MNHSDSLSEVEEDVTNSFPKANCLVYCRLTPQYQENITRIKILGFTYKGLPNRRLKYGTVPLFYFIKYDKVAATKK